jgi:hypothetical protein
LVAVHNDLRDGGVVFTTRDFFMSVYWLRLYDTEHVMAGRWGLDEKTIKKPFENVSSF